MHDGIPSRRSAFARMLQLLVVHLATAYFSGGVFALLNIGENRYMALGFWRSIWLTLMDHMLAFGEVGLALAVCLVLIRSMAFVLSGQSQSILTPSTLARCLCENRLSLLLFAVSGPVYWASRGGSWKIGAVCAMLWCVMVLMLAILARLCDAPSKPRWHGPLLAAFCSGALLILSAGSLDPHALNGFGFNTTNITVALALLSIAVVYFLLLCWYLCARPPGRASALLAFAVALLPLAPWTALRFHATPTSMDVANRKNVIVIGIDTLRADHTAFLGDGPGAGRDLTPNLRRLAKRGVVFETAISQAPWTMPSFASILTGKYPDEHGAISISGFLRQKPLTLAEVLRESGYQTAAIVSHTYVDRQHGFAQGFDSFNEDNALGHEAVTSTAVTDSAMKFLKADRGDGSFFLFLHYFDPHNVYQDHAEYDFSDSYTGWLKKDRSLRDINQLRKFRHLLAPVDLNYLDDLYSEEISHTDAQIGRLLAWLEQNNLSDNTAIIVVTDHGEEFMERGWLGHSIGLYDELIHVPLLCVLPGENTSRPSVSDVVETRGVFDLVLQYIGVSNPEIRGDSVLLQKIQAPTASDADPSMAYSTVGLAKTPVGAGDGLHVSSVRTKDWKFISDYTLNREFLYHLSADPGEKENVIANAPDQAKLMRESLNAWMEKVTGMKGLAPRMELDQEQSESLKALGYL